MTNAILWAIQLALAILFTLSGTLKATRSVAWLVAHGNTGVEGLPPPLVRFIGVAELAGAAGLVLPWATGIAAPLTPLAALCLGLIMPPAAVIHWHRREPRAVAVNAVLLALCLLVAYQRYAALPG